MRSFRELRVFDESHRLTLQVYAITKGFPRDEMFGLSSQMRRAASSVPMNIAEGSVKSDNEFHQALRIALGSAAELQYQFLLSKDLKYISDSTFAELDASIARLQRMLVTFMKRIRDPLPAPMADGRQPTAPRTSP